MPAVRRMKWNRRGRLMTSESMSRDNAARMLDRACRIEFYFHSVKVVTPSCPDRTRNGFMGRVHFFSRPLLPLPLRRNARRVINVSLRAFPGQYRLLLRREQHWRRAGLHDTLFSFLANFSDLIFNAGCCSFPRYRCRLQPNIFNRKSQFMYENQIKNWTLSCIKNSVEPTSPIEIVLFSQSSFSFGSHMTDNSVTLIVLLLPCVSMKNYIKSLDCLAIDFPRIDRTNNRCDREEHKSNRPWTRLKMSRRQGKKKKRSETSLLPLLFFSMNVIEVVAAEWGSGTQTMQAVQTGDFAVRACTRRIVLPRDVSLAFNLSLIWF